MTAPTLVLLAHGSSDAARTEAVHTMRKDMQECRREVPIHLAFVEACPPTGPQVLSQLARRGVEEVVFVPLEAGGTHKASASASQVVQRARLTHPTMRIGMSRPIGPEAQLLSIIDARLRTALRTNNVASLDGLVLSVSNSSDVRSRSVLARRARQWSAHHKLPATVAYGDKSGPSVAEAIRHLRSEGRRTIAVGSWYFTASDSWRAQAELATQAGAVAVSGPLGNEELVRDLARARYVATAMDMLNLDTVADHAAETG